MSTNASAYTVTINGNLSCTDVSVSNLGGGLVSMSCTPPDLPAGSFSLSVRQADRGLLAAPASKSNISLSAGRLLDVFEGGRGAFQTAQLQP